MNIKAMLDWCEQQLGSKSWSGKCQAFVSYAYQAAGEKLVCYESAVAGKHECMRPGTKNDRNPPAGAAVYYTSSGSARRFGHVGISDGNGGVYEAWTSGVYHHKFDYADKANGGYLGWGWHGISKNSDSGYGSVSAYSNEGASSESSTQTQKSVEITSVVTKSTSGGTAQKQSSAIRDISADSELFLLIQNQKGMVYKPLLTGEVKCTRERTGSPARLEFSFVDAQGISVGYGDAVSFRYRNSKVFYGYIFSLKKESGGEQITAVAYDQLRYFKNEDSFVYSGTYSRLIEQICSKYGMRTGAIDDTGYVIPPRVADGTLFDICSEAAYETLLNRGDGYILFDDFGSVCLRRLENMVLKIMIDRDCSGSWNWSGEIDSDVYNRIVLYRDNDQTGERELYIANHTNLQKQWGVLTMFDEAGDSLSTEGIKQKAQALLKYYARPKKTFSVKDCIGYPDVRGGSLLLADFDIGVGEKIKHLMLVEKVEHRFCENFHLMDMNVSGGDYSA